MNPLLLAAESGHEIVHAPAFPILTALVVFPALAAVLVALLPKQRIDVIRMVGILGSLGTAILAGYMVTKFKAGEADYQFVTDHTWIKSFGIHWKLGVDGISLWLVALTGLLFPLALIGPKVDDNVKSYVVWLLVLEAACMGTFLALDLFMFFVFFEVVLVPMYFLIANWGHGRRDYAAMKFFLYTLAGSAFLLVGMLALVFLHAQGDNPITFDLVTLAKDPGVSQGTARWLFLAFTIAFAVKVPLFPLHTWLPDAHTEAPTAGSVILAGLLLKMGTYGLLRFSLELFPEAADYWAPLMVTVATIGIIYGAVVAAIQTDLKRLVAYSSVAHMGFIVLGIFAFTGQGMSGATIQMINHGVSTGALFLLVGWIYERRHTRAIAELGGLQKTVPVLAAIFTVVMLSSVGLPGLNGFVGEFLVLIGSFGPNRWWAVVATTGVVLAAVYLLWAYQRVFHGDPEGDNATIPDLNLREKLVMVPLLLLIVGMGVYPKPVLDRINPSVDRLVTHVRGEAPEPKVVPHAETEETTDEEGSH
ncbi:MAG: NADH-quinone oxidoreductase subunit M [Acidimicrobiales bacterium]|nr:NADH-quinone oxidoreductase subunit M [Acidimicrobiales bacterium]